ncbi:NitT/TauT family transport system permease protein [Mycolicibacterium iranicum]|uniref:NitT/TauT family transport system permease protein n=1 Tax=Mycolicibacterium iranicum TaxID=912594 RepID=A0A839Q2K9_MYCIR|nr:ABC transporter permease [Mycolicibacterium iranicum]MBB2990109.1 NitT/TauT family transport system permease protein [Mycolicibacterium iranicum]
MAVTASAGVRPSSSAPPPDSSGTRRSWRPSFSPRRTAAALWRPVALVIVLLAAWWAVTAAELVAPYILPSPADTWLTAQENAAYLAQHTWVTTWETVVGFVIAAVFGVFVAVAMMYSSSLEKTVYPLILFAQVIPKIAIAPLFVVWLGFGPSPKILVAVLMAFFPIVISGLAGLRSVDPEILELTSTMGASRFKTFMKIRFPASLPQLMSGLKVAATLAVTGAVVGEFVGANEGLGYVILQANGNVDTAMLFAALIIMSLLGIVLFAIIEIAEKLLIPWHSSRRTSNSASTAA